MLPELHAFKVLFHAPSVGVVTSGHVTKTAVTPFDPRLPKTSLLYANCTALSFIEPELLPIEVLHCGNRGFRVFLRKIVEILKKICSHHIKDVHVAETRLLSHKTQYRSNGAISSCRCASNKKVTGWGGG